jgi:hypothetical protein
VNRFIVSALAIGFWLLPLTARAEKNASALSTQSLDCAKVGAQPLSSRTGRVTNPKKSNDAYASVALERDPENPGSCVVTYTLYLSQYSTSFKAIKTFSAPVHDSVGVTLIGFSDGGTKVAADFWWSAADYIAHRPVVYDMKTKIARLNDLGDEITGQLPPCAYAEELTGITDDGEVIVHIPKSLHVDSGCPDQGDWLFDSKMGTARRHP